MVRTTITISRQLGSGGSYIGQELARRLGICYLDRQILEQAAHQLDEDVDVLAEREERVSGFMEKLVRSLCLAAPETGYVPPHIPIVYDRDIFIAESEIIRKFAEKESVIVVGRCGFHVLQGYPGVINLFFHASDAFREGRLQGVYPFSDNRQMARMIRESDHAKEKFVRAMTGKAWRDAVNFNFCLDTGAVGLSGAVELVLQLVQTVMEGDTSGKGPANG